MCVGVHVLNVNIGNRRSVMFVSQPVLLEQRVRTLALQVRHGSDGLKDASSPQRVQHLNTQESKAGHFLSLFIFGGVTLNGPLIRKRYLNR